MVFGCGCEAAFAGTPAGRSRQRDRPGDRYSRAPHQPITNALQAHSRLSPSRQEYCKTEHPPDIRSAELESVSGFLWERWTSTSAIRISESQRQFCGCPPVHRARRKTFAAGGLEARGPAVRSCLTRLSASQIAGHKKCQSPGQQLQIASPNFTVLYFSDARTPSADTGAPLPARRRCRRWSESPAGTH